MSETWPAEQRDAWVFGYGSLMWDPCFRYVEVRRALLRGYHRALCILSIINRGTPEKPGLALGLDRGGSCSGFAFRLDPDNRGSREGFALAKGNAERRLPAEGAAGASSWAGNGYRPWSSSPAPTILNMPAT